MHSSRWVIEKGAERVENLFSDGKLSAELRWTKSGYSSRVGSRLGPGIDGNKSRVQSATERERKREWGAVYNMHHKTGSSARAMSITVPCGF